MAKICILAHEAKSLINFRGELIKEMINRGHEVKTFAPEIDYKRDIEELGASFNTIPLDRTGINPIKDFILNIKLLTLMKSEKPDVVFTYAIKPVIYGGIISSLTGIENVYSLIPGVGTMFMKSRRESFISKIVQKLYEISLNKSDIVFFQNFDDRNLFLSLGIVNKSKTEIVNGSGVDIQHYSFNKPNSKRLKFLFMGRLLKDKGIYEYVAAAKEIKSKYQEVEFYVLGPYDSNPTSINKDQMKEWENKKIINYLGVKEDVRPVINESSVFVLPSYREGTPRSVLEAMSIGRPIITTDAPGCKETVEDGYNGFIVPVKNSGKLANAMEKFIENKSIIEEMGFNSRKLVEDKYDVRKVNRFMLDKMGL